VIYSKVGGVHKQKAIRLSKKSTCSEGLLLAEADHQNHPHGPIHWTPTVFQIFSVDQQNIHGCKSLNAFRQMKEQIFGRSLPDLFCQKSQEI
jgi:hypothetical protein